MVVQAIKSLSEGISEKEGSVYPDDMPSTSGTAACRILVVDDNYASAWTLGLALELAGHQIELAHDTSTTLDKANTFKPRVILLDIGLPDANGYDICKALRQMPDMKDTLIIAQTGWGQDEHRALSKAAGFDHHMVKPVDMQKLRELIAAR